MQSIRGGAVVADKRLGLPGGPSGAHLIPAPGIPRTTGGPAPPFRAGSIVSGFPRYVQQLMGHSIIRFYETYNIYLPILI